MADINGTNGNDLLTGSSGNDTINSGNGNDTVNAGAGNDTVYAGNGNDIINGGSGMDTLFGENGDDIIDGGTEDDVIDGGNGKDVLFGGAGNDRISGGNGADRIYGGSGNDTIGTATTRCNEDSDENSENGGDLIFGDGYDSYLADQAIIPTGAGANTIAGNDIIFSGNGNDIIWGDNGNNASIGGNDIIYAGKGNDTVYGEGGNDRLMGEAGNDTINGGAGNDIVVGGLGLDTMTGGTGNDKFVFSAGLSSSDHDDNDDSGHQHHGYDHDNMGNWTDSNNSAKDVITDFTAIRDPGATPAELDKIDLTQLLGATDLNWGGTTPTANGVWYVKDVPNNVTYVYADINGNSATPELAIKLLGLHDLTNGDFCGVKNAAVTIVTAGTTATGTITEIADNTVGENTAIRSATGVIDFNDADFGSVHTASVGSIPSSYVGTFALGALNDVTTTVGWTFNVNDGALDYLAAGQQLIQNYSVAISDGAGGTVTQIVKVTITGTNDAPTIVALGTDAIGATTEDSAAVTLTDTGTIAIDDVDLVDVHSLSSLASGTNTLGGSISFSPVTESSATSGGTVGWTYSVANSATQYLALGQQATENFTVTVSDGTGGTVTQVVSVVITGTNDAPTIVVLGTDAIGATTEDSAAVTLTDMGTIAFNDIDLIDVHSVSSVANSGNALGGSLSFSPVSESAATSGGSVGWTYSVANSAAQHLAAGQTVTESFTVTVNDGKGGTVTQVVSVVVTGTNDAPIAVADSNSGLEDSTITGTVATNDSDVDDLAVLTYALNAPVAGLTLGSNGGYSFDASNAAYQHLAQGATTNVVANYTVTDEHGATSTAALTITLTGTNDAPALSAAATPASVTELTSASAQNLAAITGTFAVSDFDVGDTLTAAVVGSPTVLLNGGAFILPAGATALTAGGAFSLTGATSNGGATTIGYTYDPAAANLDFLRAGQSLTVIYGVKVNDGTIDSTTQNVTFTITGTNDAPVLSATATPAAVAELTGASAQNLVAITGTFAVSDLDVGDTLTASVVGSPTVLLNVGAFTLPAGATALTAGGAFSLTGATSNGGATSIGYTYDPAAADLDFLSAGQTLTVTYAVKVNDGTIDSSTQNVTFNITGTNDAPLLTAAASPILNTISEDAGAPSGVVGTLITSLVDFNPPAGGLNNISDADTGALAGIAVTGANTTLGTLWYSINNGGTWTQIGAVSDASALLLSADASTRVYFQGGANFSGTVSDALTFRAWDQTSGIAGTKVSAASTGGTSAFSTANDTVSITVTAVNDNPVSASDRLFVSTSTLAKFSVNSLLANDTDIDGASLVITSVGGATNITGLTLDAVTGTISFNSANAAGTGSFTYTVSDGNGGIATSTVTVDAQAVSNGNAADTVDLSGLGAYQASYIDGRGGADNLTGGAAGDTFVGGDGADTLTGSAGDDLLIGNDGNDTLIGGAGNDILRGGIGSNDSMDGGAGNEDLLDFSDGTVGISFTLSQGGTIGTPNTIANATGGLGNNDTYFNMEGVIGTTLADNITGSAGNDIIRGGGGNDILNGAGGNDLIDFTGGAAGLNFTLVRGAGAAFNASAAGLGTVTYSNFEGVIGTAFNDTLTGSASTDELRGGAGADTINGLGGNDRLVGGLGSDIMTGGAGQDTFVFDTPANAPDSITDFNASGVAGSSDFLEFSLSAFASLTTAAGSSLAAGEFGTSAGSAAGATFGAGVHVIYDSVTGNLYFDSNGGDSVGRSLVATITLSNPADTFDFNDIKVGL